MIQVTNITSDPTQQSSIILPDQTFINMTISFIPQQLGWFITNFVYGTVTINGLRICNSPNFLRQWKNILPFGMACVSQNSREPSLQQDFISGASTLYILTHDEVKQFEDFLND